MQEMSKKTSFDDSTLNDTRKFAELYSRLPREKKEIVVAFIAGMEAQEHLNRNEPAEEAV